MAVVSLLPLFLLEFLAKKKHPAESGMLNNLGWQLENH
jgi:hypothetical protein